MKEIKLTKGQVAVVDDEDYERVSAFKWSAQRDALDEWQQRVLREGMQSQLQELREQIAEYEERQRREEFERDY